MDLGLKSGSSEINGKRTEFLVEFLDLIIICRYTILLILLIKWIINVCVMIMIMKIIYISELSHKLS